MVVENHGQMVPERDWWKTRKVLTGPIPSVHRYRPGFRGWRHPQCPHLWGLRTASRHHAPWPGGPRPHGLPHEDPHRERLFLCDHRYPAPFLILSSAQNQIWSRTRGSQAWWEVCGYVSSNYLGVDRKVLDRGWASGQDQIGKATLFKRKVPNQYTLGRERRLRPTYAKQHSLSPPQVPFHSIPSSQGPATSAHVHTRIRASFQ